MAQLATKYTFTDKSYIMGRLGAVVSVTYPWGRPVQYVQIPGGSWTSTDGIAYPSKEFCASMNDHMAAGAQVVVTEDGVREGFVGQV